MVSVPPLPDLDALSLDELKKLVVQLLVEVTALREENQQLRAENARLKDLPKKPKLAPGGMDTAAELAPENWTDCLTRVLISPTGERADKQ